MKHRRERYLVVRFQVAVMDNPYLYSSLDVHPNLFCIFLPGKQMCGNTFIIYKHNKLSGIFLSSIPLRHMLFYFYPEVEMRRMGIYSKINRLFGHGFVNV